MAEQIITDLADVRDGDVCTVEIGSRQYTGPAYTGGGDSLVWGGLLMRYRSGKSDDVVVFLSATRETPSLPTEKGSVILVHEACGEVCDPPVLAAHDGTDLVPWGVARQIGNLDWLHDEDIIRWQAVTFTAQGAVNGQ